MHTLNGHETYYLSFEARTTVPTEVTHAIPLS